MLKPYYRRGDEIPGRPFCEERSISMTTTPPPTTTTDCWTTATAADYKNNPPTNTADQEVWKSLRLAFLDKYELVVAEEGAYRIWRWLGTNSNNPGNFNGRLVRWTERRLLEDPEPLTAGLWPADN